MGHWGGTTSRVGMAYPTAPYLTDHELRRYVHLSFQRFKVRVSAKDLDAPYLHLEDSGSGVYYSYPLRVLHSSGLLPDLVVFAFVSSPWLLVWLPQEPSLRLYGPYCVNRRYMRASHPIYKHPLIPPSFGLLFFPSPSSLGYTLLNCYYY